MFQQNQNIGGEQNYQQENNNDESQVYLEAYSVIDNTQSDQFSLKIDKVLKDLLINDFKVIESKDDVEKKENALLNLNEILKTWMQQVNQELNNPNDSEDSFARLLCFGSYKLGVSTPSGDIDAIVLAPNYVDREKHFFGILYNILNEYSKYNENIKDLTSVNYTHSITPLIKLEFYGVQVDLLFANMDNVAQFDGKITPSGVSIRKNLYNDFLMEHMDDKMKRSFNGFRNAEMILNSLIEGDDVEDTEKITRKIENYRNFLRCMKIFHKKKGIYENKFGYFGGITLALLTAKIFQLYPNYSCVQLIERFLYTYGNVWQWNDWKVYIVKERPSPSDQKEPVIYQDNTLNLEGNYQDKKTRFIEVYTPAYPQMNSTYNVNYSTRECIVQCYRKYRDVILNKIQQSNAVGDNEEEQKKIWKSFFDSEDFFQNYDQFMEMIIVGNEEVIYLKWKGFIEAKIRMFCEKLEILMNNINFDMQIWPFVYSLDEIKKKIPYQEQLQQYKYSQKIYIGFKFHSNYSNEIDITGFLIDFLQHLNHNWNSENQFRNSSMIDFYIFMIDKDDFYFGDQALQNEKELYSMTDLQFNKRDSINNIKLEDNDKEILDVLLD